MTDTILIHQFLNKNFDVVIDKHKLTIFDKHTQSNLGENLFRIMFYDIFDGYTINGQTPLDIAILWYKEKENLICDEFVRYLVGCKVVLGPIDWIAMDSDGTPMKEEFLISKFKDKYTPKFICNYFEKWFTDMTYDESQKIMNQY